MSEVGENTLAVQKTDWTFYRRDPIL